MAWRIYLLRERSRVEWRLNLPRAARQYAAPASRVAAALDSPRDCAERTMRLNVDAFIMAPRDWRDRQFLSPLLVFGMIVVFLFR